MAGNLRLALWSKQFEDADSGNPALCFIREMQVAGQHVAVLVALSLYKPAAGSVAQFSKQLSAYTYFRSHRAELETLAGGVQFYCTERDVSKFLVVPFWLSKS